ncbi:MAG: response regulator [Desulfobacterales bacterium]|nr:response regulator [Desulfobacterales bacterium]
MERKYTILIADRNPHVREFLRREMTAAGYRIILADKGRDVVKQVYQNAPVDLLILDPDLPDVEESAVLKKVRNRIPTLPVVVHTLISDYETHKDLANAAAFVEKRGSSIEKLREVVSDILQQSSVRTAAASPHKNTDTGGS